MAGARQSIECRKAIEMHLKDGIPVYKAAETMGLSASTVFKALKRIKKRKGKK